MRELPILRIAQVPEHIVIESLGPNRSHFHGGLHPLRPCVERSQSDVAVIVHELQFELPARRNCAPCLHNVFRLAMLAVDADEPDVVIRGRVHQWGRRGLKLRSMPLGTRVACDGRPRPTRPRETAASA